ncbi:TOM1-like protein 2 isoform X4 [Xenopus tropicalis]|uniref:TOM1-like protein 2 isoform X4 n=1 Tax=Xenopus tropicalis TaxID=8364 RepID=A0A8J0R567_XENTR|nr:TOM1-like protein 2 isoform X4 [Xenopus tropicalis]|eukprot:XP_004918137.1 PREDICTED: TOM1-like protein 2 isoform X4 [Xenopus tropicalis]
MEFLLGNPYSTPVGQCIEKATDGSLQSEDWTLNMEICDIINETEEGPKDAIRALKKRLNGNRNYREVMLALTVLETCVKNCGHRFHVLVTHRDFIDGILVKIISPKNSPPTIVQDKVLALIQSVPEVDPATNMHTSQTQQRGSFSNFSNSKSSPTPPYTAPGGPPANMGGPISANSEQIGRLRSELDIVRGNIKVMSEMLTEMTPGQEDASDLELLQDLNRTCRSMQERIVELISRVSNEEVTEELLHVNDDLNNVFLRYERFERYRSGRSAQNTNGVLSEVTEDNLIDLGPGSPAVVSPMLANTAPSNLSSQLGGLDMGSNSVSSTLSALPTTKPQDDFDMFAHTRTNSLADQRKNVTYEDPQALGGLASALDVRKQNIGGRRFRGGKPDMEPIDTWLISQGMIPVSQPTDMDDIEEWLSKDVKGDELEEGVTSEEFDKFLEERAKAAERVPDLPSPPTGEPAPPTNPAGRKKQDRSEDTLFAL